jgi:hypothetical protein
MAQVIGDEIWVRRDDPRVPGWIVEHMQFLERQNDKFIALCEHYGTSVHGSVEDIVERIAAKQEPTPAGLVADADGFYPHDGKSWPACSLRGEVTVRYRGDSTESGIADSFAWRHDGGLMDVIAWRPALGEGGGQ